MYDPKFTQKQMYEQYGKSLTNNKKADPKPPSSSGFSGMGADPAERFGGSPTRGLGAKTRTFGGGQDNNPNRDEAESRGVVARVYERAVTAFRNFGASKPDDVIVDGKKVYQGPAFRGFTPTIPTENFGGEYGKKSYFGGMGPNFGMTNYPRADVSPTLPPSTINIFGVNTDNPRLNMFGVKRGFTQPPDAPELPTSPDVPANMDPLTRGLSQAMLPEAPPEMINYTVGSFRDRENLLTIVEDLNKDGVDITLEELAKANNISVSDPFGAVKKGDVIKVPVKRNVSTPSEFIDNETKAMLRGTTPTKTNFIEDIIGKDNFKKITQLDFRKVFQGKMTIEDLINKYGGGYTSEGGDTVVTDSNVVNKVVENSLGAKQKITTDDTEKNITAYQNKLNSLGFSTGVADGVYGENTANGIRRYQERNGLEITGTMNEETANRLNSGNSIVPTSVQVGNLTVSTAYRDDIDSSQLVIATDFNGGGPNAKFGAEVVLPPAVFNAGPGNQHYDAAVKYIELVKDFFDSKGYGEYKIRDSNVAGGQTGLRRSNDGSGQRGRANTIHTEPFFSSDTKAVNIVNENKEEFFNLYVQAFGNTTGAILVAPHGKISDENRQDRGAVNSIVGAETDLGDEGITHIMNKYGNK